MTNSQISAEDKARQDAARHGDGKFGFQQQSEPDIAPLKPAPLAVVDVADGPRTLTAGEHGIDRLGPIELSINDGYVCVVLNHPEGTDLADLYSWDSGSTDVLAKDDAMAVLSDYLGIHTDNGSVYAQDKVTIDDGTVKYTFREHVGNGTTVDLEDVASWSEDFRAMTSPLIRDGLTQQIVERYES